MADVVLRRPINHGAISKSVKTNQLFGLPSKPTRVLGDGIGPGCADGLRWVGAKKGGVRRRTATEKQPNGKNTGGDNTRFHSRGSFVS